MPIAEMIVAWMLSKESHGSDANLPPAYWIGIDTVMMAPHMCATCVHCSLLFVRVCMLSLRGGVVVSDGREGQEWELRGRSNGFGILPYCGHAGGPDRSAQT